jgi:hypothetical protein
MHLRGGVRVPRWDIVLGAGEKNPQVRTKPTMYKRMLRSALAVSFVAALGVGLLGGSDIGWSEDAVAGGDIGWSIQAGATDDIGWTVLPAKSSDIGWISAPTVTSSTPAHTSA